MYKFFIAVLLVVGTTVGGGLLALPMVTVKAGLFSSIFFMLLMYLFMLIPALFIIQVMTTQKQGAHLVTMASATLGPVGVLFMWAANCFLLYDILAAYISAGGDLVLHYLVPVHFNLPLGSACVIFTVIMAMFVIPGIGVTGLANSVFMFFKALLYVLLVTVLFSHVQHHYTFQENLFALKKTVSVGVASFAYAMILPSVYTYVDYDLKRLKQVLITGTLVAFLIYVLWLLSIRLAIPLEGQNGLYALSNEGTVYQLAKAIGNYTATASAVFIADGFVSICLLTTFLGVSICLSDVIADGLNLQKKGLSGAVVYALTYLPPVTIVLFFPKIFVAGVNWAGLTCLIYIVMLPCLMIYSARYCKKILSVEHQSILNSRPVIISILLLSIFFFVVGLSNQLLGK